MKIKKDNLQKVFEPYELTVQSQKDMVQNIINAVEQGDIDPLVLDLQSKWMYDTLDKVRKGIRQFSVKESYNYNKDETVKGAKVTRTSSPTIPNLDADPEYSKLKAAMKERESDLRAALKAQKENGHFVNKAGEVVEPPPIKSEGGEYLRFTFPKS